MSNFSKSAVRTITPIIIGYVVALLTKNGLNVSDKAVTLAVGPVVSALYYLGVRYAEHAVPQAGWLLGHPSKPQYDVKAAVAEAVPQINAMAVSELTKVVPNADHASLFKNVKKAEAAVVNEVEKGIAKVTTKAPTKKAAAVKKTTE